MTGLEIQMLAKMAGKAADMVGGAIQMGVGMYQLSQAKKLPFPNYTDGMQYANENMEMYRRNYQTGIGQTNMDAIRKETSAQTAKTLRGLSESTPQFGGQVASRIGALDRITTESNLSSMDREFRVNQMSGMARAAGEISTIKRRQISAEREYKMMAEQAAGAAIKQGSENLAQGTKYMSQ
jgi:hypothetical protein